MTSTKVLDIFNILAIVAFTQLISTIDYHVPLWYPIHPVSVDVVWRCSLRVSPWANEREAEIFKITLKKLFYPSVSQSVSIVAGLDGHIRWRKGGRETTSVVVASFEHCLSPVPTDVDQVRRHCQFDNKQSRARIVNFQGKNLSGEECIEIVFGSFIKLGTIQIARYIHANEFS